MGMLQGLRSAVSFLTVFPAGFGTIEEMGRYAFLFPLIGALLGLIAGLVGTALFIILPDAVAGWLLLLAIALLTGLNHLDGLLDLGDALMVRASRERKLEILHDKHHGIGGFAMLFFVLVITQSFFPPLKSEILIALVAAETLAKTSMVIMGCTGTPNTEGLGSIFIRSAGEHRTRNLVLSSVIALAVLAAAFRSILFLIPFVTVVVFSLLFTKFLQGSFGCVTGDMLGSQGELARLIALITILLMAGLSIAVIV